MGRRTAIVQLAAVATLAACTSFDAQTEMSIAAGDTDDFLTLVQPTLRDTCTSIDCHGHAERPLRLYSLYGLRLDASLRNQEESVEELEANILSLAALDPDNSPAQNLVVLKPLATFEGGIDHVGGDIWADRNADGYRCLEAWLAGSIPGDADGEQACASAPRVALP